MEVLAIRAGIAEACVETRIFRKATVRVTTEYGVQLMKKAPEIKKNSHIL